MKYWYMQQYEWSLKTLSQVKEVSHKRPHIWFHLYGLSKISKPVEIENILVVAYGWGKMGAWGVTAKGCGISSEVMKYSMIVMMVGQLCKHTKSYWVVQFK